MQERLIEIAQTNQQRAHEIIQDLNLIPLWASIDVEANLVGSLRMELLMKHLDIDLHLYSDPVSLADDFRIIARLAQNPRIKRIEYANLLNTEEACLEWHLHYEDPLNQMWQIDMIHILKGSRYDGYFEQMADRIVAALTDETRHTILQLKYETPESEKIMGIEYYQAVLRDGVKNYAEFETWRRQHPVTGIVTWMP
jgi:hypothetical protein